MRNKRIIITVTTIAMATVTWAQTITDQSTTSSSNKKLLAVNRKISNTEQNAQHIHRVTGCVKDANGEALPGVNITVKGTKRRTFTDVNGNYSIDTGNAQALVFSYIGM